MLTSIWSTGYCIQSFSSSITLSPSKRSRRPSKKEHSVVVSSDLPKRRGRLRKTKGLTLVILHIRSVLSIYT